MEVFAVLSRAAALSRETKLMGGDGEVGETNKVINSLNTVGLFDQQGELRSFDNKSGDEQVLCLPKDTAHM